jgi:hypothetical protein
MRKIEQEMIIAILSGMNNLAKSWEKGNTRVTTWVHRSSELGFIEQVEIHVALHGNTIARLSYGEHKQGKGWKMQLENCGWATRTTHSRLNAIIVGITGLSHRFTSKDSSPKTFSKIGYNGTWRMSS